MESLSTIDSRLTLDFLLTEREGQFFEKKGWHDEGVLKPTKLANELIGLPNTDDSPIWTYALAHQAVIVTKDEDFPHRMQQSKTSPVIGWLRVGNTSRRALLEWFEPLLPQLEALIRNGDWLIAAR